MRSSAALAVLPLGVGGVFCARCCWLSAAFIPPWNQQSIKEVLQRAALIHRRISEASSCCFMTIFLPHHFAHRHLLSAITDTGLVTSLPLLCPPDIWVADKTKIVGAKLGENPLVLLVGDLYCKEVLVLPLPTWG